MRLGIFGGTFDPVHVGHLLLAEACREQCRLDEVWFVPCGQPPHKQPDVPADGTLRAEMLELATAGDPGLVVSRIELDRPGTSYTVDTLEQLAAEDPPRELFLLLGADAVADLPDWHRPGRITDLATLVAVNRAESPPPQLDGTIRCDQVTMPAIAVSSRDIRERVRTGRSIRRLVPRAVEAYIADRGLYGSHPGDTGEQGPGVVE